MSEFLQGAQTVLLSGPCASWAIRQTPDNTLRGGQSADLAKRGTFRKPQIYCEADDAASAATENAVNTGQFEFRGYGIDERPHDGVEGIFRGGGSGVAHAGATSATAASMTNELRPRHQGTTQGTTVNAVCNFSEVREQPHRFPPPAISEISPFCRLRKLSGLIPAARSFEQETRYRLPQHVSLILAPQPNPRIPIPRIPVPRIPIRRIPIPPIPITRIPIRRIPIPRTSIPRIAIPRIPNRRISIPQTPISRIPVPPTPIPPVPVPAAGQHL